MNAARSVLVGVQELLPRRRRQRFALVVLARNGLSSATECLSGTGSSGRASVRQPVPGKHDGNNRPRLSASNLVAFHGRAIQLNE